MYATSLVGLLIAFTVVSAIPLDDLVTPPPRCCPPELYQASVQIIQAFSISGAGISQYFNGHMWFDRWNKTTAFEGTMIMNGNSTQLKFIQDNVTKKQYNIDKAARTCDVMENAFPDFDGCIPQDAIFTGQETLGRGFLVNSWKGKLQSETYRYDVDFEEMVTPECIPVTATSIGEVTAGWGKTGLMSNLRFSSFQEGIQDLSVFDIPEYCEK